MTDYNQKNYENPDLNDFTRLDARIEQLRANLTPEIVTELPANPDPSKIYVIPA